MIKKIYIFIIVFIILYEIYLLTLDKSEKIIVKNKSVESSTNIKEIIPNENENKTFNYISNYDELIENIDPMMYGKPTEYEKDKIIVWLISDPKPWSQIVYKYHEKYPFYYHIKIKIPSLNDYSNWKKIIPNLSFDPQNGEIIIPCEDEETALSIANLIILNFKGELSLEDIINKNLIDISINKAKKYEVVKNKIIEQIMANQHEKIDSKESFNDQKTFNTDLAQQNKDYSAYEGTEYSFF